MANSNDVELMPVPSKVSLEHVRLSTQTSGKHAVETNSNSNAQNGTVQNVIDTSLPLNWSTPKKCYNMGIPSLMCFVMQVSSSFRKTVAKILLVPLEVRYIHQLSPMS